MTAPAAILSPRQRRVILAVAFLGWMFAGLEISMFTLITRPLILDLRGPAPTSFLEHEAKTWLAWYQCAFLFGAAAGGWGFGWLGDRIGRAKALGLSICTYSLVTGGGYFATTPEQFLIVRFISCLGIGGTWPTAVSLVAEAWPNVSRPTLAGVLGAAANFGFVLLGLIGCCRVIEPASWRWVLLVGAAPAVIGIFALFWLPESPRWRVHTSASEARRDSKPLRDIFAPPLLHRTVIGILLGAVPVIGTAVNAIWIVPWSQAARPAATTDVSHLAWLLPAIDDPRSQPAWTQVTRSSGGIVGSLIGGWIASLIGRRTTYFFISLASLAISLTLYGALEPGDKWFQTFAFLLGLVGVTYFGWLPLYLPELFPTRVRSTGTGVTFNSGRALAAVGALVIAEVIRSAVEIDYARVGLLTSGVYAIGMLIVLFAPDTTRQKLEE
jgi:SHS family sialic acid transporter-like MFS transporter